MSLLTNLLNRWRADVKIGGNITWWEILPPILPRFNPFPDEVQSEIISALKYLGVSKLYSHQLLAWNLARENQNIVISTGTASGKTLCYNLSVINEQLIKTESTALYLFPTKALAQDQLSTLHKLIQQISTGGLKQSMDTLPTTYDGDTPASIRRNIRRKSRIILTNPDMLHNGILPYHTHWENFFKNLHFVIIDEIHTYRGVFGSHVANIIRRLRRVAKFHGTTLQFILTSATIGNPIEFAEKLIGDNVTLIEDNGCARGEKHFLIYNPPIIDPNLGLRAPLIQETIRLAEDVLSKQIQTIIFCRSRRMVEILLKYIRSRFKNQEPKNAGQSNIIRAYRSGYLPSERRKIEEGLRIGNVRGVVATNALELGIDIGKLDATIMVGYPGSISSTWQQAGRAGRGSTPSLAVLLTSSSPLDQYLSIHPEYLFGNNPESVHINPDNMLILYDHLLCASYELPFKSGDAYGALSSTELKEFLELYCRSRVLHKSGDKFFWMGDNFPASSVGIRSASKNRYTLQTSRMPSKTIGEVDGESAFWMVHPQAIYMHEGENYLVSDLDIENHIAFLEPIDVDFYTRSKEESSVQILTYEEEIKVQSGRIGHGEISVTTQVVGYSKIRWETHEKLSFHELSLPPVELLSTGYWIKFNRDSIVELRERGLWNNDSINYGSKWNSKRDFVRQRDKFTCQVCGTIEMDVPHHVHHIKPFRAFISPKDANALGNLTTLCTSCHKKVEANVRIRSGLAGLAYILLNITPLYLMCDIRDIRIHQDPRSTLNGGLPILVIYDSVPGGMGFSQYLYERHIDLIGTAYDLTIKCGCRDGCPSCVGPGGESGSGGKKETVAILELLADINRAVD